MSETIFFENFDGSGPGFNGPAFESWSIGGTPVDAGHWGLFTPGTGGIQNLTPGSEKYAGVHSHSSQFIDNLVWLISPLIDAGKYRDLVLSSDIYFKSRGNAVGEETVKILALRVGRSPQQIGVIGNTMSQTDQPISQNMSWHIPNSKCGTFQIAFTWYSSWGASQFDSIQLDNIRLQGRRCDWFTSFVYKLFGI